MNSGRLLTILLVGILLSACAQFDPYRTPTLPVPPADSQTKAEGWPPEEWPPKCAVDKAARAEAPTLCKDPNSAAHAIQHRYYTGSFKYKENGIVKQDPLDERDYYLSFVEFDDQGWFADRTQMEELFVLLKKLEQENKSGTLIYVYAHGWKHNASACDNNVVCFSRLLERTDLAASKVYGSDQTVVGVYLGWRGLPYKAGALSNLSFWSRKETAARVGRGGVFELLVRLKDYRDNRQGGNTQLVITGHSFGGLVIYSALSHALMEQAAKATHFKGATRYNVAESFGDFVMLVNPAFEGSLYEPLFHIATNRCYETEQRPVMMIVTSKGDSATGKAFPIGQTLGTLFQHAKSSDQKRSMRRAIGHDDRYLTHHLRSDGKKAKKVGDKSPCPCPYLDATSKWGQTGLLDLMTMSASHPYGNEVSLEPVRNEKTAPPSPKYASRYPYLVVKTDKGVIADHNAIYNERFITFAQLFFIEHIVKNESILGDSDKQCYEEAPDCTKGGLVPCKQSCRDDDGNSCSVPTQEN